MLSTSLHTTDYLAIVAYLVAIVVIGVACSGRQKDSRAYMLGGGRMPYLALGISCLMAALSAFSLVMVPGEIYNHGLTMFVLSLLYPVFTIFTCMVFMRFYFRLGAFTPFEYLERRYSPAVRTLMASMTIYLRLIYLGMVLFSTSKIFEGAAGWPSWLTILLCGGISIAFTSAGGLKAVVWTDVMQFVVLIGGLFCILGALFLKVDGGLFGCIAYAFQHGHGLSEFARADFYLLNPYVRLSFWLLLLGQFLSPITIMASDQMTVQRLLASGSYRNAVKTQVTNTCLTIPTVIILWTIGLLVFSYYHQHHLEARSGDTALFQFIVTELPSPIPGLVIAGMLAAVISTLNSVFNSMATVYLKELHLRHINAALSEERQVAYTRVATIVIGALSCGLGLLIAYSADILRQSVVEASTIFNAFDAITIPAFVYAVLSRKAETLLVWVTAGLLWGLKFAMIAWYWLSTRDCNAWKDAVAKGLAATDFGWAGPIRWSLALPWLGAGLAIFLLWLAFRKRLGRVTDTLGILAATLPLGVGMGLWVWAFFSNRCCQTQPGALSFTWLGLPIIVFNVIIGVVWLTCGKVQPREKWEGLTLFEDSGIK
ncbi:MAG: sodium/solute symporter [Victivallales bacterium]|nr:sodium/solute symporter [Victivallales bacterium]